MVQRDNSTLGGAVSTRRKFLRRSAAVAASTLALPYGEDRGHAWGQASPPPDLLDTVRLSDRTLAVIGPDANALAAAVNDGLVLVDGGSSSWSNALLERVSDEFAAEPIVALFNTHWHSEQTGSNVALGSRGVPIIAHENTKLWLGTDVWVRWSDKQYAALPAAGIPSSSFYASDAMQIGGRSVECRYLLNAHTDGDICVLFPDENVLVTGGPVSNNGWPIIDWWTGGWIGGMLDGYEVLLEVADETTRIVPSRGPVMSLAELRTQYEMYLMIFDRLQTMLRQSYSTDEVLAARPTAEFDAQWGDPTQFLTLAFHSMRGHLRDAYDTRLRNIP